MLLFIGHYLGSQYYIGELKNDQFNVEKYGRMNWPGGTFFAPEQLVDKDGRNIIWGWILERKPSYFKNYGWSGIMSLPRVLALSKNNDLLIMPATELQALRGQAFTGKDFKLQAGSEKKLETKGKSIEIMLELRGGDTAAYGVKVFCSADGREETTIKYDPLAKELVVDFIKSSINSPVKMNDYCMDYCGPENTPRGFVTQQRAPFALKPNESLKLDIFIDKSVIEVFANNRQCVTQVVYPQLTESNEVKIYTGGQPVYASKIKTWQMATTNAY